MEAFLARDPTLKETAQRAFVSYAKSVFLMKNKKIFDVQSLDTDAFAKSLGLAIPPRIRFLQRLNARSSTATALANFNDECKSANSDKNLKLEFNDSGVSEDDTPVTTTLEGKAPFHVSDDSDSDDDGILKVKRKDHDIELPSENELQLNESTKSRKKKVLTKAAVAKKVLKKKIVPNKKIIFDEDGEAVIQATKEKRSELAQKYEKEDEGGIDIEKARKVLREEDKYDKQLFKQKVKAKHKDAKRKLKEKKRKEQEDKDEFGSDDEEEPDLSWLPDPDKIYGSKEMDEEEIEDEIDKTVSEISNHDEKDLEPVRATSSNKLVFRFKSFRKQSLIFVSLTELVNVNKR